MYTVDGRKPSQSKVKAIQEMPLPQCKKQVQSLIDMVNYISKFSAQLSELAKPIHELSKEKNEKRKRDAESLHSDRTRVISSCVGDGKVPPFPIWK